MVAKINNYKGVIIFYLLLALFLMLLSWHNKKMNLNSFKYVNTIYVA
jgi:hypothetical protein